MYVFDTDVLSLLMRDALPDRAAARIASVPADAAATTAITLGELYYGALRTSAAQKWLGAIGELRRRLACLSFDALAAERYGELRSYLESRGRRLDDADLRIAAVCAASDHVLVSGNARHFARVPGLRYENWLKR